MGSTASQLDATVTIALSSHHMAQTILFKSKVVCSLALLISLTSCSGHFPILLSLCSSCVEFYSGKFHEQMKCGGIINGLRALLPLLPLSKGR
ncbi:hypothetical protein TNCT_599921 [Trichonephila clavata]|uniref:Uncharacterized protein n=1 Tax=Trichonephila clavata TaxID=2740835 RepID=A0A8X6M5G9_TRICU|nr:hypothetical protein TNCT_599921 [Trichonephila clavata]